MTTDPVVPHDRYCSHFANVAVFNRASDPPFQHTGVERVSGAVGEGFTE